MVKKILLFLLIIIVLIAAIVLYNTFTFHSQQKAVAYAEAPPVMPTTIKHFSEAITYQTISYRDTTQNDSSQFLGFRRFLERSYPLVHQKLTREKVSQYTLLYRWQGVDQTKNPLILMAHQDVVPVEDGTQQLWKAPPFSGEVKDNAIWGRGTVDDKVNLISIMEAAEALLTRGYQPTRTIYFAFSHDEETSGRGARAVVALLKSRGVRADLVLDEGGVITTDKIPGMTKPVALIGTSEKGYLSLILSVEKHGGHSSMPEAETAIDILSKALVRLREHPFEPSFSTSTKGFIRHVGPEMPFLQKMAFANLWLFKPFVHATYEQSAAGNAMIRTTMVPTIVEAGVKENVIPTLAKAIVNFRILPGDLSADVIEKVKAAIADERVKVESTAAFFSEATAATSEESYAYQTVSALARKTQPDVITSPFLMIAATDSRYFKDISDGIIKFSPVKDPIGFHGIDEHIQIESYRHAIWFFQHVMQAQ
jgi:carboxypeptidase PM20D1